MLRTAANRSVIAERSKRAEKIVIANAHPGAVVWFLVINLLVGVGAWYYLPDLYRILASLWRLDMLGRLLVISVLLPGLGILAVALPWTFVRAVRRMRSGDTAALWVEDGRLKRRADDDGLPVTEIVDARMEWRHVRGLQWHRYLVLDMSDGNQIPLDVNGYRESSETIRMRISEIVIAKTFE